MNKLITSCALTLALLVSGLASANQDENKVTTYEMDSSDGTSTGHWVSFVSLDEKGNKSNGVAFAAVGKGDTVEAAFGITYASPAGKTGAVTVDAAKTAVKGSPDGKTTVGIVKLSEAQYKAAKEVIETWTKKTEYGEDDTKASLTFSMEVMRAADMKFPFAGLATPHPLTYFGDISIINRKLGQKK